MSQFVDGRKVNIMVFEDRAAAAAKESKTMWAFW